LLARTDHGQLTTGNGQPHAFYHADGIGNITELINSQQLVSARYVYDPFGNVLSKSGPLADANMYRFSSKEYHQPSGLVYYLYRFYDPNLQRWLSRDPIAERQGINLYRFVRNEPTDLFDSFGLCDGNSPNDRFFGPDYKRWNQEMIQQINSMPTLVQPPAQINNVFGALWHYLNCFGTPAVIGPKLSKDLQKLQNVGAWPMTTDPNNMTVGDYWSWRYPFASLNAGFTLGQFRYTNDGSTTTISDFYAFPFSYNNFLLAPIMGPIGTPYPISGTWPTAP